MNRKNCEIKATGLMKTLEFKKCLTAFNECKADNKRDLKEYKALIKCLLNFDYLMFLASNDQIKEGVSVPRISMNPQHGPSLNVFTMPRYASEYSNHYPNMNCHFIISNKESKPIGEYHCIFQIAYHLGCRNIIVNEGQDYIVIPIADIFSIGEMDKEIYAILSEEEMNRTKSEGLHLHFHPLKCFSDTDVAEQNHYTYETTWRMSWDTILWGISVLERDFTTYRIGHRNIAGSKIEWVISSEDIDGENIPDNNIFKTALAKESGTAVIYGYCNTMECLMMVEFYNQLRTVHVTVIDPSIDHYKQYQFDDSVYDNYMNSVEISMYSNIARRDGFSLYKNYIQNKQGIKPLTESNRKNIEKGIFAAHNFCPELDKEDNGNNIICQNEIETLLYDYFLNNKKLSETRAKKACEKFMSHPDIAAEFIKTIKNESIEEELSVEGFTAKELCKNHPLNTMGSYNYLIYLREEPKEALEALRKGLPRK